MSVDLRSFVEEMKEYVGFSADDAATLSGLAPLMESHFEALAERFYEEIPRHPGAAQVFKGGEAQVARLKVTLQQWARSLFSGVYDEGYAQERFRIGFRHVQIGLPQRYVISAMYVVEQFIRDVFEREIADAQRRRQAHRSLSCILNLDLNLICETYFEGSLRELRHLNDNLAAANRALQEANRVESELLANVSHELRTPLTAIIGFSKLLADDSVARPELRQEFSRDIHASALALLSLVDEILDLARVESGRFQVGAAPVDLLSEIRHALTAVAVEADRKQLSLETDLPATLPPVLGDGPRVRQVLINLLGNAVKFTDRGSVRVAATLDTNGKHVAVFIRDTGIGIAADSIPLLFEKFRQLDASHTRRYAGVGLGLAISKALVDRMRGSIEIRSEGIGKGTVAVVSLAVAPSDRPIPPLERRRDSCLVMVIGADPATRQRLVDALGAAGHAVRHATTEDGVRASAAAEPIDVVVVDVTSDLGRSMLTTGLERLIELQRDTGSGYANVFVLSDGELDASSQVRLDVLVRSSAVVAKPVDPHELVRALERVAGPARLQPMRILVVDDDPLVFSFLTQTLPSEKYSLLYARGGPEGLQMAERHPCDVILLDLRMPDGSGYEVIRGLKLGPAPSSVPIIVLTNFPEATNAEERRLLHSQLVLEVFAKTRVARDPGTLIERLEAVRSRTWDA